MTIDIIALAVKCGFLRFEVECNKKQFARLEAEIRKEFEAEIQTLKNTLNHRAKEIELLKADLRDEWIDDEGNTWYRPTSWAYAQVCRVRSELTAQNAKLMEALEKLMMRKEDILNRMHYGRPDTETLVKEAFDAIDAALTPQPEKEGKE